MIDGRGVEVLYSYDNAGRLLSETYPSDPSLNRSYSYDEGEFGIGEMTGSIEVFGQTAYSYNALGHMISKTRSINGQSYETNYTYDKNGEVLSIIYPSGRVINYGRDAAARVTNIEFDGQNIISNIDYLPFGPIKSAQYGDGHNLNINYDTEYRATKLTRSGASDLYDVSFSYDGSGNIVALTDALRADRSQNFSYDPLNLSLIHI